MKKVFYFFLPFILTTLLVLTIISVVRAVEPGAAREKSAAEGMKSEAVVSSPAQESGTEAMKEAMSVKEEAKKEKPPAEPAAPEEKK